MNEATTIFILGQESWSVEAADNLAFVGRDHAFTPATCGQIAPIDGPQHALWLSLMPTDRSMLTVVKYMQLARIVADEESALRTEAQSMNIAPGRKPQRLQLLTVHSNVEDGAIRIIQQRETSTVR